MRDVSLTAASLVAFAAVLAAQSPSEPLYPNPIDVNPPHISTDASVRYNYDIAYVRTPRRGDKERRTGTNSRSRGTWMRGAISCCCIPMDPRNGWSREERMERSRIPRCHSTANGSITRTFAGSAAQNRRARTSSKSTSGRRRSFD